MRLTTTQKIELLRNLMKYLKLNSKFDITIDQINGKTFAIAEKSNLYCEYSFLQPVTDFMEYKEIIAFIKGISKAQYFTI